MTCRLLNLEMPRYILVLVFALLLALVSMQSGAQQTAEKNNSAQPDLRKISAMEFYCFDEVNRRRKEHGLAELLFSDQLREVARAYSRRMAEEGFFSHADPQGRTPRERVREAGLKWTVLAENLLKVKGFINPVPPSVDRWMGTPAHRQNILEPDHEFSGVGVWMASDETYFFTQLFLSLKPQEKK
ncbi:MAG: CAP domain-containing protein [Acidobacteriota bacterium]